jgi:Protein of unknown function (DUF3429)
MVLVLIAVIDEAMTDTLPRIALRLGFAGLLPQIIAVFLVATDAEQRWSALAVGYAYAAFIFSFLGGVWWGQGLTIKNAPLWIYAAAVAPSLIALATYVPWVIGAAWPGPSLAILGICLILSPLVDRAIGQSVPFPPDWMRLRIILSLGLGGLTLLLSWIG